MSNEPAQIHACAALILASGNAAPPFLLYDPDSTIPLPIAGAFMQVGKSLAHYEIIAQIGVGGMGEVWRARDTKLNREVALKFLRG
jgi:serine/threonine protein kinase